MCGRQLALVSRGRYESDCVKMTPSYSVTKVMKNRYSKIVKNMHFCSFKKSKDYLTFDTKNVTNPVTITHYRSILPSLDADNQPLKKTDFSAKKQKVGAALRKSVEVDWLAE